MRNGEKLPKLGGIASNNRHGTSVNNAFGHGQGSKTEFETKTPYRSDNFSGFPYNRIQSWNNLFVHLKETDSILGNC